MDDVLILDRQLLRRPYLPAAARHVLGLLRTLRRHRFNLVVDFQGYGETALLSRLTGARERWGCATRTLRRRAYTRNFPRPADGHPADGYLDLLDLAGIPAAPVVNELRLPEEARAAARRFGAGHGLDPAKPWLFLQPFTSAEAKNWPLDKHLALARSWREDGGQVIFGGGPDDKDRLVPAGAAGFVVAAGAPLLTSAALARQAAVIVGGDTGLLHFVVALGGRVLALMRTDYPGCSTPYRHPEWVLSPPPGQPVAEIPVSAVWDVLAALLKAGKSAGI